MARPGTDRARRADQALPPATDYSDASGQRHRPSDQARCRLLPPALGAQVDTPDDLAERGARARRELWGPLAEPYVAVIVGTRSSCRCGCPPWAVGAGVRRSRSRAAGARSLEFELGSLPDSHPSRPLTARSDASCACRFPGAATPPATTAPPRDGGVTADVLVIAAPRLARPPVRDHGFGESPTAATPCARSGDRDRRPGRRRVAAGGFGRLGDHQAAPLLASFADEPTRTRRRRLPERALRGPLGEPELTLRRRPRSCSPRGLQAPGRALAGTRTSLPRRAGPAAAGAEALRPRAVRRALHAARRAEVRTCPASELAPSCARSARTTRRTGSHWPTWPKRERAGTLAIATRPGLPLPRLRHRSINQPLAAMTADRCGALPRQPLRRARHALRHLRERRRWPGLQQRTARPVLLRGPGVRASTRYHPEGVRPPPSLPIASLPPRARPRTSPPDRPRDRPAPAVLGPRGFPRPTACSACLRPTQLYAIISSRPSGAGR